MQRKLGGIFARTSSSPRFLMGTAVPVLSINSTCQRSHGISLFSHVKNIEKWRMLGYNLTKSEKDPLGEFHLFFMVVGPLPPLSRRFQPMPRKALQARIRQPWSSQIGLIPPVLGGHTPSLMVLPACSAWALCELPPVMVRKIQTHLRRLKVWDDSVDQRTWGDFFHSCSTLKRKRGNSSMAKKMPTIRPWGPVGAGLGRALKNPKSSRYTSRDECSTHNTYKYIQLWLKKPKVTQIPQFLEDKNSSSSYN